MKKESFSIEVSTEKAMAILESFIRRNNCSMSTDTELVIDPEQTKGFDASEVRFMRIIKHKPQPTTE